MLEKFRRRSRTRSNRYQAQVEILEDRLVPATITLTGAGRFQDNLLAGLVSAGGDNFTAINLRSAIVGANSMPGADTIILESGTYTMNSGLGQFLVSDPYGSLTIQTKGDGVATIDAQGKSRIFLNQSTLMLTGLKLQNSVADTRGGAIFNNGTLAISNCQFVNNLAFGGQDGISAQGGAIYNYTNRILSIQNSTFSGNVARAGIGSLLSRSAADAAGGAIFIAGSRALVTDTIAGCTFVNNQALGGNGVVRNSVLGNSVLGNSVLGNGTGMRGGIGAGGALFVEAGSDDVNVVNCTFTGNIARGGQGAQADGGNAAGGGVYLQNGGQGSFRLVNDTLIGNTALGGQGNGAVTQSGIGSGGGLAGNNLGLPLAKVINTIVAKNSAKYAPDVDGIFASLGSNLIGDNTGASASFNVLTGDFVGTAAAPLDPGLDPLGNYGGPTQTFRPKTSSLAIDRGNSSVAMGPSAALTTDQRGQPRRSGVSVDIGAYEAQQPAQNKTYTLAQGSTLTTTAANDLLASFNNPLNKVVTVKLVPGSGPASGKLTLNANGTFTYKAASEFYGSVSFRFTIVVDGQETDTFTVTLNVAKTGRLK